MSFRIAHDDDGEPVVMRYRPPLQCALCGMPRWNDESVTWLPLYGDSRYPYCSDGCDALIMRFGVWPA